MFVDFLHDLVGQVKNAWYAVGVGTAAANFVSNNNIEISDLMAVPNPVINGHTTISYMLSHGGNVTLKLADANGNILQVLTTTNCIAGYNRTTVSLPMNLQKGYYYVLIDKDGIAAGRIKLLLAE